ncbi:DUF732 domain-containing protein [[Mycobacterium] nativiensis]|uniref:DUF732 domain-containing protein n=1 Tax=[Mycobacterium] nativiensis TaxID=2855503 RepID=A0ABU5Y3G1_9MYCO|nr:DUF732 domain-containing protein [Mycolicibacter sp. MYC340]MEB3034764.1 DUF732 domain-containing protein [Mycolicibacter sp. MYC340]
MPSRTDRAAVRQRWIVTPVVSLATALTAVMFAGPALAAGGDDDEAGYLDYVRSHGVPYSNLNPDGVLGSGYHYCSLIHEGMSPQRIIDSGRGISLIWIPTMVYAAQHFLCRDTLTEADLAAEAEPQPSP